MVLGISAWWLLVRRLPAPPRPRGPRGVGVRFFPCCVGPTFLWMSGLLILVLVAVSESSQGLAPTMIQLHPLPGMPPVCPGDAAWLGTLGWEGLTF